MTETQRESARLGVIYCVTAHLFWGGMAPFLGLIRHIPAAEIAANRGLWSLPLAALVITWFGQWADIKRVLQTPKHLGLLALTSVLILFNWGFYIWSIENGRALEASLGYFINPLLNVVAGYFLLGERFKTAQILAIGLATIAVVMQTISTGVFPWLGLMLGGSFCVYGLIRKTVPVGATQGFMVELLIIMLPLLIFEVWRASSGTAHLGASTFDTLMLMGTGAFTTGALLFFSAGIRRIRYATAGIIQYISPSLVFLTAVFMFHEKLDAWRFASFLILWVALAIYSWSAWREN
jgi:chloramphenicol-sensitive protein RarD